MRSPDLAANAAITSRPSGLCFLFYGEVTHGSRNAWNFARRAIVQRIGARPRESMPCQTETPTIRASSRRSYWWDWLWCADCCITRTSPTR